MSVNRVILVGHLGKDPDVKYLPNGEAVANVSLATSEHWKGKDGEKQERTDWHNLVFYRRLAEIAGEYLKKGALIYVEGKIQTRKYQSKEGQDRYITEIIVNEMKMLGSRNDGSSTESTDGSSGHSAPSSGHKPASTSSFDNFDDDKPPF